VSKYSFFENTTSTQKKKEFPVSLFSFWLWSCSISRLDCGDLSLKGMKKEGNEEPAVYTWGWGKEGQLGQGNRDDKLRPKILSLKDIRVTEISAGLSHTVRIYSLTTFFPLFPVLFVPFFLILIFFLVFFVRFFVELFGSSSSLIQVRCLHLGKVRMGDLDWAMKPITPFQRESSSISGNRLQE
jgi:hypothetical protein